MVSVGFFLFIVPNGTKYFSMCLLLAAPLLIPQPHILVAPVLYPYSVTESMCFFRARLDLFLPMLTASPYSFLIHDAMRTFRKYFPFATILAPLQTVIYEYQLLFTYTLLRKVSAMFLQYKLQPNSQANLQVPFTLHAISYSRLIYYS